MLSGFSGCPVLQVWSRRTERCMLITVERNNKHSAGSIVIRQGHSEDRGKFWVVICGQVRIGNPRWKNLFYFILLMILSLQQMQAGSQSFWFLMQFTSTVSTQLCGHLSRWNETCRNLFYSEGCVLPSSSVAALALLGLHLPVQPRTVK